MILFLGNFIFDLVIVAQETLLTNQDSKGDFVYNFIKNQSATSLGRCLH